MRNKIDLHFIWLLLVVIGLVFIWVKFSWAKDARTVRLNDEKMAPIFVHPGQSVILNFPVKPNKVILGNKGLFSVEYVENDLAVSALTSTAKSNLFVFLTGRRFGFDLITTMAPGDEIVLVRDRLEKNFSVKVNE
jgi:hypothetical protein